MKVIELRDVLERYHVALDEFSRGDPEPVKKIFSHADDVTLANPFGPAVRGWKQASDALDYASARMREGRMRRFETIAEYEAPELVTILELEHWESKVSGRSDVRKFDLRVTTTFRLEGETWRIAHRHADPIATPDPDGPLRATNG